MLKPISNQSPVPIRMTITIFAPPCPLQMAETEWNDLFSYTDET